MSCFCSAGFGALGVALPALNVSAALNLSASAAAALNLSNVCRVNAALDGFNPAWLALQLPVLSANLSASALLQASALVSMRAQIMAKLGLDLLVPAQRDAFARMTATLDARLRAMLAPGLAINLGPWLALANLNAALMNIQANVTAAATGSAGVFARFNPALQITPAMLRFIGGVAAINMVATLMAQLDVRSTAALGAALTPLAAIRLPALGTPALHLMASLSAGLLAVAGLGQSLGVDPLAAGFPAIRAMVGANLSATVAMLASAGIRLDVANAMPGLPLFMTGMPLSAMVSAAVNAAQSGAVSGTAAFDLDVSALLAVGLGVSGLAINLSAALGLNAAPRPCAVCDHRTLTAALPDVVTGNVGAGLDGGTAAGPGFAAALSAGLGLGVGASLGQAH